MKYSLDHIAGILGSSQTLPAFPVEHLLLDSRKVYFPATSLFFAVKGPRRDGHQFIPELYKKGVRSFVVSDATDITQYPDAGFIQVSDTVAALQQLAIHHRRRFGELPVIGITGSNGKTIVKEWLYQALHGEYRVTRSPKSFNSQVGVPLSVWGIDAQTTLGIFEAGISQPGEMQSLERIIRPSIGLLTNIGEAHDEGFSGKAEKLIEKLNLFKHCAVVIGRYEDLDRHRDLISNFPSQPAVFTWGKEQGSDLLVKNIEKGEINTSITVCPGSSEITFSIPFSDDASVENAINLYMVLRQLDIPEAEIARRMNQLQTVNMRLELKKGINHCTIINDSYSADLNSLAIALNFLDKQGGGARKTVILSDFLESAEPDAQLYSYIIDILKKHRVSRLIGIGERISHALRHLPTADSGMSIDLHPSTASYTRQFLSTQFRDENILIKGARIFGFEEIVQLLEQKVHQTILEINLNAIVHNIRVYQQHLRPSTRIMAMVKAFAYGSGGAEIAGILQFHKVDYLGVAYADEGVELRKAGVLLPIMVMNPEESAFESIVEHNLEPDLYSFEILRAFEAFLEKEGLQNYRVHLEIETGMNRLGFAAAEIESLADHLQRSGLLRVQTVFSHLAASEDPAEDEYTLEQYQRFLSAVHVLREKVGYDFIRHIANSAAISRLPDLQLDMVRLGIGMYGIDGTKELEESLLPAASLKTTIAQLKYLRPGETVSYNRRGKITRDSVIATVRIGYADGYSRRLGHGVGKMYIRGKMAPVIGTVCMDMTMIDVTDIPGVEEGDEVIVFGKDLPIQRLAEWAGSIPYEIMTGISQRVKRVYFEE